MKKNRSLNFVLNYGVYNYDVMFSFGETDKQLFTRLRNKLHPDLHSEIEHCGIEGVAGKFIMFECGAGVVRLHHIPMTPFDWDTLAHEIFHAVSFVLRRIGIEHTIETEEAYAYAISFLTKGAHQEINKFKRRKR